MRSFGEPELEALYARLEKPLYNVLYRRVWSREEARDLVQETFVKLWRMRRRIVPDTVEPLVYKIAINLARSRLRPKPVLRWLPLEPLAAAFSDPRGEAEPELARDEARTRLREAVLALPEDLRDVVLLCEFSGMSYRQVAEALAIPEGTVGSRRNRALKRLREDLERS